MQHLQRIATFPLEPILWNYIQAETPLFTSTYKVRTTSPRLRTYLKGVNCAQCGAKGSFFALEQAHRGKNQQPHLNLYAITAAGKEVMMTSDHILPKSLGGRGHLGNRQPMCIICNMAKGNNHQREPLLADCLEDDSIITNQLITHETWSPIYLALNVEHRPVSPHSCNAKYFSLLGSIMRLTLHPTELWNMQFEKMRSRVINVLMHNVGYGFPRYNSYKYTSLQELNAALSWPQMQHLITLLNDCDQKTC